MKKTFLWPILFIIVFTILAWFPITQNNSFFYDDWEYIRSFQNHQISFHYLMAGHNEHFMPMFKIIFILMLKIFGQNIAPFMWLSICLHVINTILFYCLINLIFPGRIKLSFILTMIFGCSSTYYEVLHWFSVFPTALSLMFLQFCLILLHQSVQNKNLRLFWWSIGISFFIPMNFSLGLTGIFIITLYYFLIIKKELKLKNLIKEIKFLSPYFILWGLFLILFYFSVYSPLFAMQATQPTIKLGLDLNKSLSIFALCIIGLLQKSMGLTIWGEPFNMVASFILLFNFIVGLYFIILYLVLNKNKQRISLLNDKGISYFVLVSICICYISIALTRTNIESMGAFLGWGRYHYFPYFFACIFLGNFSIVFLEILGKVFNKKRLQIFISLLVLLYLLQHLTFIQQKASSTIRLEGNIRPLSPAICQLASTHTNVNTAAAIELV